MFLHRYIKRVAVLRTVVLFAALTHHVSAETNAPPSAKRFTGSSMAVDVAYGKAMAVCEAVIETQTELGMGSYGMQDCNVVIRNLGTIKGELKETVPLDLSVRVWPKDKRVETVPNTGDKIIVFIGDQERGAYGGVRKIMAHTPENLKAVLAVKERDRSEGFLPKIFDDLKSPYVWGESADGVCLSVSLKNGDLPAGQPVWVTVRVKNTAAERRPWVVTLPEGEFFFDVKDASGNDVPRLRYQLRQQEETEILRRFVKTLAPNQMIEHEINLSRRFDFSLAGEYSLQVTRVTLDASLNGMVTLVSNTATFSIW